MADTQTDVKLYFGEDKLSLLLDCSLEGEELPALASRISKGLKSVGVADPPSDEDILNLLTNAGANEIKGLVLAEGYPAKPPVNGYVEWCGNFFQPGFHIDEETGTMDYRRPLAEPNVKKGQMLARVVPPQAGVEGRNVLGQRIKVGKAKPARIRPGANVEMDASGSMLTATIDGRVRFKEPELCVDDVLTIEGNAGLATGHIEHSGAVEILGNVEPGSQVSARGDIVVMEMVEGADLKAGGSLTVIGGVVATGKEPIMADGSVQARYIMEADIEAGGDVVAVREVRHANVKTRGRLDVRGGRLVGGRVTARGGVAVKEAGSDAVVPTQIIAGEDFAITADLAQMDQEIAQLEEMIKKIRETVEPQLQRRKPMGDSQRTALKDLLLKAGDMKEQLDELKDRRREMVETSRANSKCEVVVHGMIFPETEIRLRGESLQVRDKVKGPLKAIFMRGEVVLTQLR